MKASVVFTVILFCTSAAGAQTPSPAQPRTPAKPGSTPPTTIVGVQTPPDYVIGPEDQLTVVFWGEKEMSGDVTVRPDGKITLPLLNEVDAAGLTTEQLREKVSSGAARFFESPNVTIVVKEIKSRKVFVTGMVHKPGTFQLMGPTTVLQLIAMAGGLQEFADSKKIVIMRTEKGQPRIYKFNYKDVIEGKNLRQNIELKPGDTVVIP
jgi:polysaccharide export outer membrane protein